MNELLFPKKTKQINYENSLEICHKIVKQNYENFPILMFFIDKEKMDDYAIIYAFSRGVDFIGDNFKGDKLKQLAVWESELKNAFIENASLPVFVALQKTIIKHDLRIEPFLRLIEANKRDQQKKEYKDVNSLIDYCDLSANPVGEIVLRIMGYKDEKLIKLSNSICTGLQITNFLQDIVRDKKIGRVYIPYEIMRNHKVSKDMFEEEYIHNYASKKNITNLLNEMIDINRNLYNSGNILPKLLTKKDRTIIQIFIDSGEKILSKIEKRKYNSLFKKPSTNKFEKFQIILKSILKSTFIK